MSGAQALDADAIAALLPAALRPRVAIDVHASLDSTQAELLRRGRAQPDGGVCLADTQTGGRGRRGRAWVSPPQANLYLSLFRRVQGGVRAQAGLSLALGVAAAEALRARGAGAVGLKWPNDLVARGRKLGGLLVETLGDGDGVVAGIGINVQMPASAHGDIDQPWIDLATLGAHVPRNTLAAALVAAWMAAFDRFADSGLDTDLRTRWAALDTLADAPVRVAAASGDRFGVARGLAPDGALQVEIDGRLDAVHSGDVSLRRA